LDKIYVNNLFLVNQTLMVPTNINLHRYILAGDLPFLLFFNVILYSF